MGVPRADDFRMPAYGPICTQFHDADKPRASDAEVAWYEERLPRDAGPVLEAMCGSGRLLVPLVQRGFHVHGVDTSAAMLASCEARLAAEHLTTTLLRQDLAELNAPFRYGAVFVAAGSFQLLANPASAKAALQRIHAHLVPPGLLLLDLSIPDVALHPPAAPLVEVRTVSLADRERITLRSETRVNTYARQLDITLRYEKRERSQRITREDETRVLTWYDEAQIQALLEETGFSGVTIEPAAGTAATERAFGVRARAAR
jgi:SAM-dependent methyltransferase